MAQVQQGLPASSPNPSVPPHGRPRVCTTFQFAAEIPVAASAVAQTLGQAVNVVLEWVEQKARGKLPAQARDGSSFAMLDVPGRRVACVAIPELCSWALRLEHPDGAFRGRQAVAGRNWTTDVAITKDAEALRFGVRIQCASPPSAFERIELARPRVVVDLARRVGLTHLRPLDGKPWLLRDPCEVEDLYALLTDPRRDLPVVVLTQPDPRYLEVKASEFVVDAERFGRDSLGLCIVALLPRDLSYYWTDRVGKPWAVFNGAARTYMPGLSFDADSPNAHPRKMVDQIVHWRHGEDFGEAAFCKFVLEKLIRFAASRTLDWHGLLFLAEARVRQAVLVRQKAHGEKELLSLYEAENEALRQEIGDLKARVGEYVQLVDEADRDRDWHIEHAKGLRAQILALRENLKQKSGTDPDKGIPQFGSYEELPEWMQRHLPGRVILHPRALRGLKDAEYEDRVLVQSALLLLANEYRNMKLGAPGAQVEFDNACRVLSLRYSGSITESRAGEEGETYFLRYPTSSSPRRFLESHLRKGISKDPRHCLAIYFFWDDESSQVVVGWLPSHLENRMS